MQRILAGGKTCKRPACVSLCPDRLPSGAQPPFSVTEAGVCGPVRWQEIPSCRRGVLALLCLVPVALRLTDACGRCFSVDASAEEELTLCYRCPENEGWRGQIFVQAAARPWRRTPCARRCACGSAMPDPFQAPIELLLEGYLLSPCAVGGAAPLPCPDPRPLYPCGPFER